jgi:hypothetical protein
MTKPPRWFLPVAVLALLWNALGCAAYLADVMMSPEAVAQLPEAQRAMHAARPAWSVAATATAVWFGAAGSLGLVLRKRWATAALTLSLLGVIVQDASFLMLSRGPGGSVFDGTVVVLQGLVLAVALALVGLSRAAAARGWLT